MTIDYLELKLAAIKRRVDQDVFANFGEIDYRKLMDASGSYNNHYLNTDAKTLCAHAVASLIAARAALDERDIEGTLHAIDHVTHFWSVIYSHEQQAVKATGRKEVRTMQSEQPVAMSRKAKPG